jgi:zinc D-Ala-D-Ala dipeptidase
MKKILFAFLIIFGMGCKNPEKTEAEAPFEKAEPNVGSENEEKIDIEKNMRSQGLVNIQEVDTSILVDLKYSTEDNFFKKDVYGKLENAYLQKKVAFALSSANLKLQELHPNLKLIVYDGARPLSIQHILWNSLSHINPKLRKNYVADPEEGSIHNFGCAVDLSIYDTEKREALDMGTPYDFFGERAYPRLETEMLKKGQLDSQQVNNRKLLRTIMVQNGFQPISSEWWHFNYYSRNKAKKLHKIIL